MNKPEPIWYREDRVFDALKLALNIAIRNGGQPAKAFAWDVNCQFRNILASVDRSGEAGETSTKIEVSTEGESAVPNEDSADAQTERGHSS